MIIGQVFGAAAPKRKKQQNGAKEHTAPGLLARLRGAARKESWGRTVLNLAWTAGPATYLALHGAYLIGYGSPPPQQLILYFGIYTVIAGFVAVLMRFVYNAVRGHEEEEGKQALEEVLEKLPDLVSAARNANLESYDDDGRLTLAAKYVIEDPDASPTDVSQAVLDLTGSNHLASAAAAAEVYRQHGLTARVHDLYASVAQELGEALESVAERSTAVAQLMRRRFNGLAPTKRAGRIRVEGFIERVFSAGEQDDESLVTMSDVEEVLTLCFELLNRRSYPVLMLNYSGGHAFTAASARLDAARRGLRSAIHARNSRLRALAEHLNSHPEISRVAAAVPSFRSVGEIYQSIESAMASIYETTFAQARHGWQKTRDIERNLTLWRDAVRLHHLLYKQNFNVRKKHLALYRAAKEYAFVQRNYAEHFPLRLMAPHEEGSGIRLRTRTVTLSEHQRHMLASTVRSRLETVSVQERFSRAVLDGDGSERRYLSTSSYKQLAIELLLIIERYIPLHQSRVQYTIEGTNAPNLSSIHSTFSGSVKRGWGESLVRELETSTSRAAERLASALVTYHGVTLTESSISYLEESYGVDRGKIPTTPQPLETEHLLPRKGILEQLLFVPRPPRKYHQLVEILQRKAGLARMGMHGRDRPASASPQPGGEGARMLSSDDGEPK